MSDTNTGVVRTRRRRRSAFGIFAVQVGVIVLVAVAAAGVAVVAQIEQVRRGAEQDLVVLADSVATLPDVVAGMSSDDPTAAIQPITTALQAAAGVEYITVADMAGRRVAHPRADLIGEQVSSDHAEIRQGGSFVGAEEGPMGLTLRAKAPIVGADGEIVGTVSVGTLQSAVDADVLARVGRVALPTVLAVAVGVVIAWFATARLRRRLYGVAPEDMLALVHSRQALAEGVRDGMIGVDRAGRISVVNAEARRLLDLRDEVVGRAAEHVLPAALTGGADPSERVTRQVSTAGRTLVVTQAPAVADGRRIGSVIVLQDRSELESMLSAAERERTRAEALRVETHDFDNRMSVVSGLLSFGELDSAREYLASLPRAQRPGTGSEWSQVDSPLVAALLASRRAQAEHRDLSLALTEDSRVSADFACGTTEVTVLGNLVSNAIEAARTRVEVFVLGGADGLSLMVDDDGDGVRDPEAIFRAGHTSKTDDPWRHGIGLDVVRALVEERDGSISVERSPAGGARFSVDLPAAAWSGLEPAHREPATTEHAHG